MPGWLWPSPSSPRSLPPDPGWGRSGPLAVPPSFFLAEVIHAKRYLRLFGRHLSARPRHPHRLAQQSGSTCLRPLTLNSMACKQLLQAIFLCCPIEQNFGIGWDNLRANRLGLKDIRFALIRRLKARRRLRP